MPGIDFKKWSTSDIGQLMCKALSVLESRGLFGKDNDNRRAGFASILGFYKIEKVKDGLPEMLIMDEFSDEPPRHL